MGDLRDCKWLTRRGSGPSWRHILVSADPGRSLIRRTNRPRTSPRPSTADHPLPPDKHPENGQLSSRSRCVLPFSGKSRPAAVRRASFSFRLMKGINVWIQPIIAINGRFRDSFPNHVDLSLIVDRALTRLLAFSPRAPPINPNKSLFFSLKLRVVFIFRFYNRLFGVSLNERRKRHRVTDHRVWVYAEEATTPLRNSSRLR